MKTFNFAHIVDGQYLSPTESLNHSTVTALDPYTGETLWVAASADARIINAAVNSARAAAASWAQTSFASRQELVGRFVSLVKTRATELAEVIARESGKPLWESLIEANAVATKFDASVEAYEKRAVEFTREVRGSTSRTRYKPHGVFVVLSPFNFPASMGNSHLMPAVLAGNTVILKPSELTPLTGLFLADLWQKAGLPAGVVNCITGDGVAGANLVEHGGHDGVLFVGGYEHGSQIVQAMSVSPQRIAAIEAGGNSPLVIVDYDDVDAVVHLIIQSTFISSGQRCSAARRLYVRRGNKALIDRLTGKLQQVRVGSFMDNPEPYYGPMIRPQNAQKVLNRTAELIHGGADALLEPKLSGPFGTLLSPGLLDMTNCNNDKDEEIFGPVLKVYEFDTLEDAIAGSNNTRFGLAAGIVTKDAQVFDEFFWKVRSGIVNWNQQLTGATTFAPFGGVRDSGNNRPAGYHSVDYCSYPVASIENSAVKLPGTISPGLPFGAA